jgi:hypothetical protein
LAPFTQPATATSTAAITCSMAIFWKENAVPVHSDIPGRPEMQVGRWHAMWKRGDEQENQGAQVRLVEEDVDWESVGIGA